MSSKYLITFSFVVAFSTQLNWTKIMLFGSSFIRTNDKDKASLTDNFLFSTRICPLDYFYFHHL